MYNGYDFYFKIGSKLITLPITPAEVTITSGSNNKVVTLINEGDINILKSPSLTEISFDARFPMRKYPYSREVEDFEYYYDEFTKLKTDKKPCKFSIVRAMPNGKHTWGSSFLVAIEDLETKENADEGDDVIVSFTLKQYKDYGVVVHAKANNTAPSTTSTAEKPRSTASKDTSAQSYTVKSGDCLWNIAKKYYGNGADWKKIYNANKSAIEADARKHGKESSSEGHWIWSGLKLTIPAK